MSWFRRLFGKDVPNETVDRLPVIATVELPPSSEPVALYKDQVLRKQWFESVIEDQGIPVNKHLPCIESEAETTLREPAEVARRLFALLMVAAKAEGIERERLDVHIAERGAESWFTPAERAFFDDPAPSDLSRAQFSWRYEAAWVLAWALRLVEDAPLAFPGTECDVPRLIETVRETTDLSQGGMQSANNVLNEADLIYRYHWTVRDAQINGHSIPGGLHPGIVVERHYALNWLIGYCDQDWDDVSTDT